MNETMRVTRAGARQVDQQQLEHDRREQRRADHPGQRAAPRRAPSHISDQRGRRPQQRDAGLHRERIEPGVDAIRHAAVVMEGADQHRVQPDEAGAPRATAQRPAPRDPVRRAAQPERDRDERDADADVERIEQRQVRQRRAPCRRRRRWRPASTASRPAASTAAADAADRPPARRAPARRRAVAGGAARSSSAAGTTSQPSHGQALAGVAPAGGDGAAEQRADSGEHEGADGMDRMRAPARASAARPGAASAHATAKAIGQAHQPPPCERIARATPAAASAASSINGAWPTVGQAMRRPAPARSASST